jgi:hypothetical protein
MHSGSAAEYSDRQCKFGGTLAFFWTCLVFQCQPFADGVECGLGAAGKVQLAQDVAHMRAHGRLADRQLIGNLLVAQPLRNELQYRQLALGERFGGRLQVNRLSDLLQKLAGDGRM